MICNQISRGFVVGCGRFTRIWGGNPPQQDEKTRKWLLAGIPRLGGHDNHRMYSGWLGSGYFSASFGDCAWLEVFQCPLNTSPKKMSILKGNTQMELGDFQQKGILLWMLHQPMMVPPSLEITASPNVSPSLSILEGAAYLVSDSQEWS